MSTHDIRDKLDGLNGDSHMLIGFPDAGSMLHNRLGSSPKESSFAVLPASHYKRKVKKNLHADRRGRFRTQPITCMEIKEVDEETLDNASACLTGPLDDNDDNVGSSAADINSIAEERQRERRSQNDLKRQFEEFSRNLSFRNRSAKKGGGGGSTNINHPAGGGGGGKRAVEIPSIIAVDEEDDEAAEDEDEVGVLIGLSPSHDNTAAASDIDFPQGYTFRPRPSI